jgi:ribosomal protein L40E
MTFNPPQEGLKPGENVVWARNRGTSFFVIFFSGMLGIGGTVGTINALVFVGLALALPLLILMIIGFVFIIRAFIEGRGTKYYLTNERLIEARKGQIVKEVSLDMFQGKSLSQLFQKRVMGMANNQPVYVFKICDPLSGDTLMEFKDLDIDSVEALERVGQIVECRYCSFKNSANSLKCRNCGAPL